MEIKTFQFPDGAYDQYESVCENGSMAVYYTQVRDLYRNIDEHISTERKAVSEYYFSGDTCYVRQSCLRDEHIESRSQKDVEKITIPIVYYKQVGSVTPFVQSAVSTNKIECTIPAANPILDKYGSYLLYPLIDGAIRIETTWQGKPAIFYLNKHDVDFHSWRIFTLADADAPITIYGNVKSFMLYNEESGSFASRLSVTNNTAFRAISIGWQGESVSTDLTLQYVPNLCEIDLSGTIARPLAQVVADAITASEIEGDLFRHTGNLYSYIIANAAYDKEKWVVHE